MLQPLAVRIVIPLVWTVWGIYWFASSFNVKRTRWRAPLGSQLWYRLPIMAAAILLLNPNLFPSLAIRLWPQVAGLADLGAAMVVAGLALAVMARIHLGRNWSATVTVKDEHTLIRTGPYRIVRHPIYTGMSLALLGVNVAFADWRTIIATVSIIASFVKKLSIEERAMAGAFPEYEAYRRGTWALVPFLY